jgi:hypothetical protein
MIRDSLASELTGKELDSGIRFQSGEGTSVSVTTSTRLWDLPCLLSIGHSEIFHRAETTEL